MLVRSKIAQRMFDADEVLVAACKLIGLPGVTVATKATSVDYYHVLFDDHQIIFAEGAATESLFTGPQALRSISAEVRREIEALFPQVTASDHTPAPARPIPEKERVVANMVARHARNLQPVQ